jgi:hypothetical protein
MPSAHGSANADILNEVITEPMPSTGGEAGEGGPAPLNAAGVPAKAAQAKAYARVAKNSFFTLNPLSVPDSADSL